MSLLNVQVLTATTSITDSLTVASVSPYTITLTQTPVTTPTIPGFTFISSGIPTALQFTVSGTTVTFNAAAAGTLVAPSYQYATVTYTPSLGATSALVELWGGGGAGGGASGGSALNYSVGSGGAAGGYAKYLLLGPVGPYTVAIGSGGLPVPGAAGGSGGDTTFTNGLLTVTAHGGFGGNTLSLGSATTSVTLGGDGALASSGGTYNGAGANGDSALVLAGSIYTAPQLLGGGGGSTALGGGGASLGVFGTASGNNSIANTGSGGGGAINTNVSASYPGGAGAAGVIIISEYA